MTTTDLEPAAWMYASPFGTEIARFRWARDEGLTSDHWVGWTETPLYTADQLQALIEERDRLREEVERLRLDVRAQECLQDSAYKAGFKAGWNAGIIQDEDTYASTMRSTEHIAELRKVKAVRAALAGEQ